MKKRYYRFGEDDTEITVLIFGSNEVLSFCLLKREGEVYPSCAGKYRLGNNLLRYRRNRKKGLET